MPEINEQGQISNEITDAILADASDEKIHELFLKLGAVCKAEIDRANAEGRLLNEFKAEPKTEEDRELFQRQLQEYQFWM